MEIKGENPITMLRRIASENSLTGRMANDFVKFFELRFPHHVKKGYIDYYYASEWALRFYNHYEWYKSDFESRAILVKINPDKYGTDIHATDPKEGRRNW